MPIVKQANERWFPTSNASSRKQNYRVRLRSRPQYATATDFQIELSIIRNWDRLHGPDCPTGLRWFRELATYKWQHRLACVLSWNRSFVKNPWTDWIFENLDLLDDYTLLNVIGSQNSTKSNSAAAIMVQLLIEDPEYVGCFIASPYREATTLGIWGNVKENFRYVAPMMGWNADNCISDSKGTLTVNDGDRAGWVKVVSVDKVGMLQGKKPRSTQRGGLYLLIEESGVFDKTPAKAVWDVLQNLTGQPTFKGLSTCNFKSVFGLDGLLCQPIGKEYDQLDPDEDHEWDSVLNGRTIRLDGHKSPNIGHTTKPFPFIVGQPDIDRMIKAGNGPKSAKYLEQIRSFPVVGSSDFTVTNKTKLTAGGVYSAPEEPYTHHNNPRPKWAFADPGLGGDPFKIAISEEKRVGNKVVIRPVEMIVVPIDHDQRWTEKDIDLATTINPKHGFSIGQDFTEEMQGALRTAKILRDKDIPPTQFGFDGSMRASVQRAIDLFIGPDSLAMDYLGPAPDLLMPSGIGNAKDLYASFLTFIWFLAADMMENGFVRDGEVWEDGFKQMCSRLWEWAGKKKKMETKDDYKARNANESPDDADALIGNLYLLFWRSGHFQRERKTPEGTGGMEYLLQKAANSGYRSRRIGAHLAGGVFMSPQDHLTWRR